MHVYIGVSSRIKKPRVSYLVNVLFCVTYWDVTILYREKEGDLTQSYDKTPYTNRKFENQRTTHKRHQKLRLHNDCGPT